MGDLRLETRVAHAGGCSEDGHRALSTPISQASVFAFPSVEVGSAIHEGEEPGFFYGRMGTPTQAVLEEAVADLEGAEAALATSSGMSALAISLLALLKPGDHLVAQHSLYTTTQALLREFFEPMGVTVSRVDPTAPGEFAAALRGKTRAILLESPSNPGLRLADIRKIAAGSAAVGAKVVVDSTFATPINQQPLALGAHLVVHSATKYLGGHGDLVAGVLAGERDLVDRARWGWMRLLGPALSPFNAWLVLRGLKTLAVRMHRHNATALRVAQFLSRDSRVKAVHYPGLESHPQHELASRQMTGFGGILSFEVAEAEEARRMVNSVRLCARATSLGDVVSLIQHCGSLTQASLSSEDRKRMGLAEGLIRLSVGLEAADDIVSDLDQALEGRR